MITIKFNPGQTFNEVRELVKKVNSAEYKGQVAKLTWREGTAKDQTVTYLYDAMAERFGHTIDKESIGVEIFNSLMIGIPVDVTIAPRKKGDDDE